MRHGTIELHGPLYQATPDGIQVGSGNTASRPVANNGVIRFNTDFLTVETAINGIWYNLSNASATASNVSNTGIAVFSVAYYGSVSNAVSQAISAGGGIVYVPQGVWPVSSPINITIGGVYITGAGQGIATIRPTFANASVFKFYASSAPGATGDGYSGGGGGGFFYGGISNLSITFASGLTPTVGYAIEVNNTSVINLKDLTITGGYSSIGFINCGVNYVKNVNCANMINDGIFVNGTPGTFIDTYTCGQFAIPLHGGAAIHIAEGAGTHINECGSSTMTNALLVKPLAGKGALDTFINGSDFDDSQSDGVVFDTSLGGFIYNTIWIGGRTGFNAGNGMSLNDGYNYNFSAIQFDTNVLASVKISGGAQINFSGCSIIGASSLGSGLHSNLEISGGTQINITGGIISTVSYANGTTVPTSAPYGVSITSGFTGQLTMVGTNFQSGVSSYLSDSSSATVQISKCAPFVSESFGTFNMPASTTVGSVSHGCSSIPTVVTTSIQYPGYTIGVAIGSTALTFGTNPVNGAGPITIYWSAKTKYA